ncbi:MAG: carboxypeptidase-like regulatory domain-containing protein [Candidatus Phocaeicola faecigallinarum]|uniref:Carboxypeptidase-like regulatory domain-containing protein n=1 Tax=Candidatus Phocaeicola faecigallinarum TaxID=2838732 RepID=A0A948TE56_9BACT|nr:carboxypeptidase-like regulatory domain-containing protein [Candidatus Phocaeicola faecigallinarum]
MKLKLFTSIALLLLPLVLVAQGRVTVSGTVNDKNTGEPLPSATVSIAPSSDKDAKKYTSTDMDGKFTFTSVSYDSYVIGVTYATDRARIF